MALIKARMSNSRFDDIASVNLAAKGRILALAEPATGGCCHGLWVMRYLEWMSNVPTLDLGSNHAP
jgi:hypothetical protein